MTSDASKLYKLRDFKQITRENLKANQYKNARNDSYLRGAQQPAQKSVSSNAFGSIQRSTYYEQNSNRIGYVYKPFIDQCIICYISLI